MNYWFCGDSVLSSFPQVLDVNDSPHKVIIGCNSNMSEALRCIHHYGNYIMVGGNVVVCDLLSATSGTQTMQGTNITLQTRWQKKNGKCGSMKISQRELIAYLNNSKR